MRSTYLLHKAPFLCLNLFFCVQSQTQGDTDKSNAQLVAKKRRTSRSSGKYGDILLWGDLIVYTSPDEAIASLSSDDVDDQRVRLVKMCRRISRGLGRARSRENRDGEYHRRCPGRRLSYMCPTAPSKWGMKDPHVDTGRHRHRTAPRPLLALSLIHI